MKLKDVSKSFGNVKNNIEGSLLAGGVAGAGLTVASLFGLPIPTALGAGIFVGGHALGALIDLYRNKNFAHNYDNAMHNIERREVIQRAVKKAPSSLENVYRQHTMLELKAISTDIQKYGNRVVSIIDSEIKSQSDEGKVSELKETKRKMNKAMSRTALIESTEIEQLDEVLAPIVLAIRLGRKLRDDTLTTRKLKKLFTLKTGEETKYERYEQMTSLIRDFTRDYRRGLIKSEEYVVAMKVLGNAIIEDDPSKIKAIM